VSQLTKGARRRLRGLKGLSRGGLSRRGQRASSVPAMVFLGAMIGLSKKSWGLAVLYTPDNFCPSRFTGLFVKNFFFSDVANMEVKGK